MKRRFWCADGLVTWDHGAEITDDKSVPYKHLSITKEQVRLVLDVQRAAIDRCLAAFEIPSRQLRRLMSRKGAENMIRVVMRLRPKVVTAARQVRVPLRELVVIAGGKTEAEQIRRLLSRDVAMQEESARR